MWQDCLGNENFNKQFKLICNLNPDIICLQEATWKYNDIKNDSNIIRFIEKGYHYIISSHNELLNNLSYGILVLSKTKYINWEIINLTTEFSQEKFSCIKFNININNFDIYAYVTHLDVHDNTDNSRSKQLEIIFNNINNIESNNIILLGDFNLLDKEQISTKNWEYIYKHDVLRGVETKSNAINIVKCNNFIDAYNYIKKSIPLLTCCYDRRVDYIFLKKNIEIGINDINVIESNVSDHLPMILDCKLLTI